MLRSPDEIKSIVITAHNGTPVLVRDIADMTLGNVPVEGISGQDDLNDVVSGIVSCARVRTLQTRRSGRGGDEVEYGGECRGTSNHHHGESPSRPAEAGRIQTARTTGTLATWASRPFSDPFSSDSSG